MNSLPLICTGLGILVFWYNLQQLSCSGYDRNQSMDRLTKYATCWKPYDEKLMNIFIPYMEDSYSDQPLSLALMSSNKSELNYLAESIGHVFFPSLENHGIHRVNLQAEIQDDAIRLQQKLRDQIATTLSQCPKRTMFIFEHTEVIEQEYVSIMDVLLDPLTGSKSVIRSDQNELFDAKNGIFLFLFHVTDIETDRNMDWRRYLEDKWQYTAEKVTPSAIIGRIGNGLVMSSLEANHAECEKTIAANPSKDRIYNYGAMLFLIGFPILYHHT